MKNNFIYYVNGKFVPKSKAFLSVLDIGFLRGYGVFDYFITYNKRPFLIDEHIDRLFNSAGQIGLKIGKSKEQIKELIIKTLRKNSGSFEKSVRIVITGGVGKSSTDPSDRSSIIVIVEQRHRLPDIYYQKGAKAITYDYVRPSPLVKSLEYTNSIKALNMAKKKNSLECIFVDKKNNTVSEATTSNVFIVKKDTIYTSDHDVLNGITKDLIIRLLKKDNPVIQKTITLNDLMSANEVFISASNKEIIPIIKIDNHNVADGKVGATTRSVMDAFHKFVKSGKW